MTHEEAKKLIEIYGKAWETKDPDLITTIFSEDATYNDPKEKENIGIDEIKEYWKYKVIGEQDDIKFYLRNVWVDGDIVIAEWHATFKDIKRNILIDMDEVAIFTTKDGKFSSADGAGNPRHMGHDLLQRGIGRRRSGQRLEGLWLCGWDPAVARGRHDRGE